MKNLILAIILTSCLSAHTIGGAYASLVSCNWGQYGYEYGYIGEYEVNGETYTEFFGDEYCEY